MAASLPASAQGDPLDALVANDLQYAGQQPVTLTNRRAAASAAGRPARDRDGVHGDAQRLPRLGQPRHAPRGGGLCRRRQPPRAAADPGHAASVASGAWNARTVPTASITSGTTYWIAILSPSGRGTLQIRDKSGGGRSETSAQGALTALPQTWKTGHTWSDGPLSATGGP